MLLLEVTIPTEAYATLAVALAWYVLGFVLYATVFAVGASLVSRQEDLGATTFPLAAPCVSEVASSSPTPGKARATDAPTDDAPTASLGLGPRRPRAVGTRTTRRWRFRSPRG